MADMKVPTLALSAMLVAGCATMHKPDETPQIKAQDKYECEQQTYAAASGNSLLLSNGFYRDCMRARGYN
jgi:hypothetical protein